LATLWRHPHTLKRACDIKHCVAANLSLEHMDGRFFLPVWLLLCFLTSESGQNPEGRFDDKHNAENNQRDV